MSYTITYSISKGVAPYRVWLLGSNLPLQFRTTAGIYTFYPVEQGDYTLRIIDAEECVWQMPVSVIPDYFEVEYIDHICELEYIPETTTTTTQAEEYPCNFPINYYGYSYEKILDVFLGDNTGTVFLDFNTFYIPVKIIVEFNGNEVINTGYRGNAVFQAVLNIALTELGEPLETINTDSNSSLVFVKDTSENYARMKIYTPLDGSIATIKLRCPINTIEEWSAAFTDHTCSIEEVTTTTTPEPVVTTTTTEEPIVTTTTTSDVPYYPCNYTNTFGDGIPHYPYVFNVNAGSNIGQVAVFYDASGVPDRFIVKYQGDIVIDSGYYGIYAPWFDFGGYERDVFINALSGKVDPATGINYPDFVNYPDDGYPRVTAERNNTEYFLKESSYNVVTVEVYSPLNEGTNWTVRVYCPVPVTTTTTTP